MPTFVFANNVNAELSAAITSTATTLTISSTFGLPASIASGWVMALTLNDAATRSVFEIVYVTAISGNTLTITRGQEGTAAAAWSAGDYVYSAPTGGQMVELSYGHLLNVQVFRSSGTYTPFIGTSRIVVDAIGGGGGGGSSDVCTSTQATAGGSGSAGAYARAYITSGFSGAAVTVGAGGAAGNLGAGGTGGQTSFGSLVVAPGGNGGQRGVAISPPGGTGGGGTSGYPTGGNIISSEGPSVTHSIIISSGVVFSSAGASTPFGAGGAGVGTAGNGVSASGYGAGGSGAVSFGGTGPYTGGAGGAGVVIIYEYS